jgi:hypothetical protein
VRFFGALADEWTTRAEGLTLRWLDPSGAEVQHDATVHKRGRRTVTAELAPKGGLAKPGIWQIEVLLDGERTDRTTFRVVP